MNIPAKPAATEVEIHGNFVDGREIEAGHGAMLDVRNPATGDVIARIPNSTADGYRPRHEERARRLRRQSLGRHGHSRPRAAGQPAGGRLRSQSRARCTGWKRSTTAARSTRPARSCRGCRISSVTSRGWRWRGATAVIPVEGSYLNYTLRTPIGIVANCTPFNHPLMILCKSLAAVLASGCVTVVKPSEYTPLTTLKLAQIFTEAGLPPGVFNIVLGLGPSAGKMLAEHPDINKLVLTGGTEAGRIAGSCGGKSVRASDHGARRQDAGDGVRRLRRRPRRQLCGVRRLHRRRPDLRLRLAPYRAGLDLRRVRREAARPRRRPSGSAIPSIPRRSSGR